ncbi:hypothetical protein PINS_up015130 [Pythium insidiosum]|nr:hypothetical protein PINS_up015130 [Pythium insidiosum]
MGRFNTVELLVSAGAKVNAVDIRGCTPLASASRGERISREHTAVVTFLVKNGATISRDDATAALYIAAQKDLRGMVKPLVDAGAVIDHVGSDHKTPLILASWLGRVGVVKALLAEGASIDLAPCDGLTALHWAVRAEHVAVIKALVRHGASVMVRDAKHATPLLHACCLDKPRAAAAIVDTLKQLGKKTELTAMVKDTAGDGCTPLHMACLNGSLNIVRLLVANEASLSEKMTDTLVKLEGATPLSIAVRRGFVAITKCLVDAGADVVAKDDKGSTPVDSAVEMDNVELMKALLKRGRPDPQDSTWDGSVQKALMTAARRDKKDLVGLLIAFPVIGENGMTSLMKAVVYGLVELVSLLVDHGGNVNVQDSNGFTALHYAATVGIPQIIELLVRSGASVRANEVCQDTPLFFACTSSRSEIRTRVNALNSAIGHGTTSELAAVCAIIDTLKSMGEDDSTIAEVINATGSGRWAPVNIAASAGNLDLVKLLAANGAALTTTNDMGFSALHNAVFDGKVDVVKFLLEQEVEVATRNHFGSSPMHTAASKGNVEIAEMLLAAGADLDDKNHDGASLLHAAVFEGRLDMVMLLVNRGANLNARTNGGDTALLVAATKGHHTILTFLVRCGARLDVANDFGATPLSAVCMTKNADACRFIVSRLYERGQSAHMDVQDYQGRTALHWATSIGYSPVVEVLVEYGANVNVVDFDGNTALDNASFYCHEDIVKYLKANGAVLNQDDMKLWTPKALLELHSPLHARAASKPRWFIDPKTVKRDVSTRTTRAFVQADEGSWFGAPVTVFQLCKMLKPSAGHLDSLLRVGFAEEIRRWYPLNHPYILKLYGACHRDNQLILVVERTTGGDLREFLQKHPDKKYTVILQVALAVQYLHERGTTHGQIRSDMIRMTEQGVAKLGGFGLCSCTIQVKEPKDPEWKKMAVADGMEGDVYALAMCMYEAVTGEAAFAAERQENRDIRELVEDGQPPKRDPAFSDRAWDLIKRMSVYHVRHRPHIGDVVRELQQLVWEEETCSAPESDDDSLDQCDNVQDERDTVRSMVMNAEERLSDVWTIAGQSRENQRTIVRYQALVSRLKSEVKTFTKNSSKFAFASAYTERQLEDAMFSMHNDIDRLSRDLGVENAMIARTHEWRQVWLEGHTARLQLLESKLAETEFTHLEDRVNVLTCLEFELTRHRLSYTNIQPSNLHAACKRIQQEPGVHVADWFIPPYEIETTKQIAKGYFGEALEGKWMNSDVVVKKIFEEKASSDTFSTEVGAWFQLYHPHVVQLFGACHLAGQRFFVCEKLGDKNENCQLDKYLDRPNVQRHRVVWQRLYEAAAGLQYLHYKGIIHGDLKCNNILVSKDGIAKLTDFGFSSAVALKTTGATDEATAGTGQTDKDVNRAPQSTSKIGARRWKAPEILRGELASPESDVYGLAMCVVEAVTGKHPWHYEKEDWRVTVFVKDGHLMERPSMFRDAQWELVEQMTRRDASMRLPLDQAVEAMRRFAKEEAAGKYVTAEAEAEAEPEPGRGVAEDAKAQSMSAFSKSSCANSRSA